MKDAFEFEESGLVYSCVAEARQRGDTERWWWFSVSRDQHRYAPFMAESGDTLDSVKSRIVQYYNDLLFRRAQPAEPRSHWAQRNKGGRPAAQPATAATAPAAAPAAPEATT